MSGETAVGEVASRAERIRLATAAAIARHDEAIQQAEIRPGDPLEPAMAAQREFIVWTGDMAEAITQAVSQGARGLTKEGEAELVRRVGDRAMAAAKEAARAYNLRTLAFGVGGVLVLLLAVSTTAYFWGRAAERVAVQETEQRLAAAFQDGPAAAATWATLMENNDITRSLSYCTGPRAYTDAGGRHVCQVPLYVEPQRRGAPGSQQ